MSDDEYFDMQVVDGARVVVKPLARAARGVAQSCGV
jgi:hypothetical protein